MVARLLERDEQQADPGPAATPLLHWGHRRLRSDPPAPPPAALPPAMSAGVAPRRSAAAAAAAAARASDALLATPPSREPLDEDDDGPDATPTAAELLMALCNAASGSATATEDDSPATASGRYARDAADPSYDGAASRRGRRVRQRPGGGAGGAAAAPAPSSDADTPRYRFGPGKSPGSGSAGGPSGGRQKSCAFVGVRRRQWGTYAAEMRNQLTGAREWLGTFEAAEEAAVVYDARLRQVKGPAAKCNFPPLDASGKMVNREICPRGKSHPDRLTLEIPADWLRQVAALSGAPPAASPPPAATGPPAAPAEARGEAGADGDAVIALGVKREREEAAAAELATAAAAAAAAAALSAPPSQDGGGAAAAAVSVATGLGLALHVVPLAVGGQLPASRELEILPLVAAAVL